MDIKIKDNQSGYTMFELLVALAIMIVISTIVVVQIQVKDTDKIRITTEQLASNLRQVRNLATSRVINNATGVYPPGGYGINFDNTVLPNEYVIFADDNDNGQYDNGSDTIISEFVLENSDLLIYHQLHVTNPVFFIIFKNEHEIITDIVGQFNTYILKVRMPGPPFRGEIKIFDQSLDGYTWGNINVSYDGMLYAWPEF